MKKLICICLACLILLAAGCSDVNPKGQPEGEMESNGGIAVRQGDFIYYINGTMPATLDAALANTEQAAIFRLDKDGNRVRISTRKAYELYIVGESIYFVSPAGANSLGIYRVSINGGSEQKLLDLENGGEYAIGSTGIAAEKNKCVCIYSFATGKTNKIETPGDILQIYYSQSTDAFYYYVYNRAGIMQTDCNAVEPVALTDRNGHIVKVEGSNLYYIKNDAKLVCVNTEYGEETQLTNSDYHSVILNGDNSAIAAYSKEKQTLYGMKLDGSNRVLIAELTQYSGNKNLIGYTVYNDIIFYSDSINNTVMRCDIDGLNPKKIADFAAVAGNNGLKPDNYMDVVQDKFFFFGKDDNSIYCYDINTKELACFGKTTES